MDQRAQRAPASFPNLVPCRSMLRSWIGPIGQRTKIAVGTDELTLWQPRGTDWCRLRIQKESCFMSGYQGKYPGRG